MTARHNFRRGLAVLAGGRERAGNSFVGGYPAPALVRLLQQLMLDYFHKGVAWSNVAVKGPRETPVNLYMPPCEMRTQIYN